MQHLNYFICLCFIVIIEVIMYKYINKRSTTSNQLVTSFKVSLLCMALWCISLLIQILLINFTNISPIYADYLVYIAIAFLPVAFFFIAYTYVNNHVTFKKWFLMLGVIPLLTVIILWTNGFHHLFYKVYSINPADTVFGPYFYIHSAYTYGLFLIDLVMLIRSSMKSYGVFSARTMFVVIGSLIPVVVNITGMTIFKMNIYVTPISFLVSIILFAIAILKYNFLDVAPIALKSIVDQMSDLYVVLNKDYKISDCNRPFENVFNTKKEDIIGKDFNTLEFSKRIVIKNKNIGNYLEKAQLEQKVYKVDATLKDKSMYFNIEISGIFAKNQCVGILILFKDTTQHILDMNALKDNQNMMMERERLATLGQMVGGIAHNLKTPIMSIAGAMEGLQDLIVEYDESIDDPDVTADDHHSIANDMKEWITKVNSYDSYMSDIISAVKGQAVNMSNDDSVLFTITELLNRVDILMKHELKNAFIKLNVVVKIDKNTCILGNVNSLVQVINNLISNAIQSYDGKPNNVIDLLIYKKSDKVLISIVDHGSGIPEDVQKKLFSEMITTKGHNGTGLGLFMSYSTIKGHFNGDMNFTSKIGVGTTFNILLPYKK